MTLSLLGYVLKKAALNWVKKIQNVAGSERMTQC